MFNGLILSGRWSGFPRQTHVVDIYIHIQIYSFVTTSLKPLSRYSFTDVIKYIYMTLCFCVETLRRACLTSHRARAAVFTNNVTSSKGDSPSIVTQLLVCWDLCSFFHLGFFIKSHFLLTPTRTSCDPESALWSDWIYYFLAVLILYANMLSVSLVSSD